MSTETGSSKAETILPNPIPVNGNPALNNKGGITVPKRASTIPHLAKIPKWKIPVWVAMANPKTITAPPNSINKLRCADEIPMPTRLAVNMVVVNEVADRSPKTIPRQSKLIWLSIKLVANAVPIRTTTTDMIFWAEGIFFSRTISNTTPIQTVCINKIIAMETGMYFTAK